MQREHQEIPSTAERLLEAIVWHGSLMDCKALVRIHGSPAIITGPSESPDQRSPLHWAVLYNREEIVEWFLEQHPVGIDNVDAVSLSSFVSISYPNLFCSGHHHRTMKRGLHAIDDCNPARRR
eukprot:m.68150 g.68150  ORF g.68150 m.68150 type:complete len:123 (-) comp50002_c0_seq4:524-892(-)